jgi:hypothetical protein
MRRSLGKVSTAMHCDDSATNVTLTLTSNEVAVLEAEKIAPINALTGDF